MHIILDLHGCNPEFLKKAETVEKKLAEVVKKLGLNSVHSYFHQFEPFGVTGFILLKESHISIHTWPENEYAAIDIFSCRKIERPEEIVEFLKTAFSSKKAEIKVLDRLRLIS
ncbi:MAG: adenosylmethionine decarboxylase [Candidatus Micrarchaeota archaeon]|nr:adenosylmethionine decarboxylase [Candidatus Micrarchaeota archaeon]